VRYVDYDFLVSTYVCSESQISSHVSISFPDLVGQHTSVHPSAVLTMSSRRSSAFPSPTSYVTGSSSHVGTTSSQLTVPSLSTHVTSPSTHAGTTLSQATVPSSSSYVGSYLSQPTAPRPVPGGAIAGGVVGGLAVVALLTLGGMALWLRHQRMLRRMTALVGPEQPAPPTAADNAPLPVSQAADHVSLLPAPAELDMTGGRLVAPTPIGTEMHQLDGRPVDAVDDGNERKVDTEQAEARKRQLG
jgi:hypothetical protein